MTSAAGIALRQKASLVMSPPIVEIHPASSAGHVAAVIAGTEPHPRQNPQPAPLPKVFKAQAVKEVTEVHKESFHVADKLVSLGFHVDTRSNTLKIQVTNQSTGQVVREFELKGIGQVHHEPSQQKGLIVDNKT